MKKPLIAGVTFSSATAQVDGSQNVVSSTANWWLSEIVLGVRGILPSAIVDESTGA
jgi:hypothetical protein